MKPIHLRINDFEIDARDEWHCERNLLKLRCGTYDYITIKIDELKDLKEIIKRFEESQK